MAEGQLITQNEEEHKSGKTTVKGTKRNKMKKIIYL